MRKKIFILFYCGIFFTKLSINSSMLQETNFSTNEKLYELKQHPFINRLQKLSKDNSSMFSFLGGLGAHYIFKKAANNIYKQIALPVITWSLGHTICLLFINKEKKNIKKILIPSTDKSLEEGDNYLAQEFLCFPFINFAKKIISKNQETITNNIINALDKAKKNSLLASWTFFGFMSPILYKKIENHLIKKILWYGLFSECSTLAGFLANQENRNIDAVKEYLLDHKNPKGEISFYGSPIKIYPILNLALDFTNTLFFKQNIINKFLSQLLIKELDTSLKEVSEEDKESFINQICKNPTRQTYKEIKKQILKIQNNSHIFQEATKIIEENIYPTLP